MMDSPHLPTLNSVVSLVPQPEIDDAWQLVSAAIGMEQFVENFRLAVELFDLCELEVQQANYGVNAARTVPDNFADGETWRQRRRKFRGWQHIASRDGAIQIYHIGKTMQSIREHLRGVPTLCTLLDIQQFRTAWKLFESYFPNFILIRDAVAHSIYEIAPTAKDFRSQAPEHINMPGLATGSGIFITNSLYGNKYLITKDKKVASYEISHASYAKLASVRTRFLRGFDNARAEVARVGRNHGRSTHPEPRGDSTK